MTDYVVNKDSNSKGNTILAKDLDKRIAGATRKINNCCLVGEGCVHVNK